MRSPTLMSSKYLMRRPALRRSSICGQVSVITRSPRSLNTSQKKLTKPRSGLLCETRVPLHAAAQRQAVARADRLEPLHLVDARRAHRGCVEQQPVGDHLHHDAARVPARGAEPAQHGVARRLLVEMHRLRIELRRKADDLLARDTARPILGRPVGVEILEIILRHGSPSPTMTTPVP